LPAMAFPFATGSTGLPVGVQLVGPVGGDSSVMAVASWMEAKLSPGFPS
jgi:aspartyl-tRNA(Asn)/glutamyl-tRNA(Gln) amidotransferase subunit A